uniref:HMG box domain-containing protein n=1 Tax=Heterosigma akashiwo TaxID=2829 RepID=A0A6V1T0V1_HETAK|mmetsp:Transcript_14527/g.22102  ORF Transcript_14527/g.22102 Transcript_14527/m.22102 type:complete len:278 (+) Transcript_14527:154-987(+)
MAEPTRRSGRERKVIDRMEFDEETITKTRKPIEQKGSGTALGEIESIKKKLSTVSSDEEVLILTHRLMYGSAGKGTTRKKTLRDFNGFAAEDVEGKKEKLNDRKWTIDLLRELCDILCLTKSGKKSELVDAVVDFLASPSADSVAKTTPKTPKAKPAKKEKTPKATMTKTPKAKASKKRAKEDADDGKKKKKKKQKSDKPKVPKPLSAFMYFSQLTRPSVKEEFPDLAITEVAKKIGELWATKTDDEKAALKQEAIDEFNKKYPNGPPGAEAKEEEA